MVTIKDAREMAQQISVGNGYVYTNRDLQRALFRMESSSLFGSGDQGFAMDLLMITDEIRSRSNGC